MIMQIFVIAKHKYILKLAVLRKEVVPETSVLEYFSLKFLLFEQVFVFLHPNIWMVGQRIWIYDENVNNYYFYHVNDILSLFMQLKLIYLLSYVATKSKFGTPRAFRVCNMFGTKNNIRFVVKCMLKDNPLLFMLSILLIGVIFFSWAKILAESPLDRLHLDFQKYTTFNAAWGSIVTMSTVGYGDIIPKTYIGRIITIFEI